MRSMRLLYLMDLTISLLFHVMEVTGVDVMDAFHQSSDREWASFHGPVISLPGELFTRQGMTESALEFYAAKRASWVPFGMLSLIAW